MASGSDYKSIVIAKEFANKVGRTTALAVTQSQDSDTWPTVLIGTGVAGTQNFFVKFNTQVPTQLKDSLGLQQTALGPHVAQVVLEEDASTATESLLSAMNNALFFSQVASFVNRIELYLTANGTAPTAGGITGQPVAIFTTADNWSVIGDM